MWYFLIGDEDLDGEPVEISDTSNESSQDGDGLITRLPGFLRGNENSQSTEVTQNASIQTIDSSEPVARVFSNRPESSETDVQNQSNPFEMSLTAYVRSRNNAFGRPVSSGSPSFQQFEQLMEPDTEVPGLDVQTHNNPLRAIFEEGIRELNAAAERQGDAPVVPPTDNPTTPSPTEQRELETGPEQASASTNQDNSNATETLNVPAANVVIGK